MKYVQVVVVLVSCIFRTRRECCADLVVSVQGVDLVLHVQVVVAFGLFQCLCKVWICGDLVFSVQRVIVVRLLYCLYKALTLGCLHKSLLSLGSCTVSKRHDFWSSCVFCARCECCEALVFSAQGREVSNKF